MTGYIKLWRKVLNNGMMHNPELLRFWVWCLLKASHKPYTAMVGYQEVDLEPGQFVFGINAAANELDSTPRKMRTCVDTLVKTKNLTRKTTNKFSILTVINWDRYQTNEEENDKQNDKQATSKRQASDNKQECKEYIYPESKNGNYPFRFKKAVPIPSNFHLTDDMKAYANKRLFKGDLEKWTHDMILSARSGGYKKVDWHATWKKWLSNHIDRHPECVETEKVYL
jgi:hypothetical protein